MSRGRTRPSCSPRTAPAAASRRGERRRRLVEERAELRAARSPPGAMRRRGSERLRSETVHGSRASGRRGPRGGEPANPGGSGYGNRTTTSPRSSAMPRAPVGAGGGRDLERARAPRAVPSAARTQARAHGRGGGGDRAGRAARRAAARWRRGRRAGGLSQAERAGPRDGSSHAVDRERVEAPGAVAHLDPERPRVDDGHDRLAGVVDRAQLPAPQARQAVRGEHARRRAARPRSAAWRGSPTQRGRRCPRTRVRPVDDVDAAGRRTASRATARSMTIGALTPGPSRSRTGDPRPRAPLDDRDLGVELRPSARRSWPTGAWFCAETCQMS